LVGSPLVFQIQSVHHTCTHSHEISAYLTDLKLGQSGELASSYTAYNLVLFGAKPITTTTPVVPSTSCNALVYNVELLSRTPLQGHVVSATEIVPSRSVVFGVHGLGLLTMEAPLPASTHKAASNGDTKKDDGKRPSRLLNLNKSPQAQKRL
jgi:hypothetical protein